MATEKNIYIYKVHEGLYRLRNIEKGTTKDVKVAFGEIVPPWNSYNLLSPTEAMIMNMILF